MNITKILQQTRINVNDIVNDLSDKDLEYIEDKYINVVKHSNTELGVKLSMGYPRRFQSAIGACGSIRNAVEYLNIVGYPRDLLGVSKLTKKQINRIPNGRRHLPNYISAVATLVYDNLVTDPELIEDIKNSTGTIISYNRFRRKSLGTEINVYEYNHKLSFYTKVLRIYAYMIRNDLFTTDNVKQIIEHLKDDKSLPIFHGAGFSVK